ncbi:MAG: 3'-5' exonuclease [Planctomycetota bacterium]
MMTEQEILQDVNAAQLLAITHGNGPLLVIAGPGSGKTRVITRRIAHLLLRGVPAHRVLAITFTNKAAGEMRERVEQMIGEGKVWISTFHSLGARLLRIEADKIGLDPGFTIYDADDQVEVIRTCLKERGLDPTHFRPEAMSAAIQSYKASALTPEQAIDAAGDFMERKFAEVYRLYFRALRDCNALDFDDLLYELKRLLTESPEARARWTMRFEHVLIDEYQDTNRVQYEIARELGSGHGNICATGDPDQSIYRWRGAQVRNIVDFEHDFPGTTVVKLEQNYRSTNNILRAATAIIRHNPGRKDLELFSMLGDGEPVAVLNCPDESLEADEIARRIRAMADRGRAYRDFAILLRTNALSRSFERGLRTHNIPYRMVGGVEFYRRKEVKDLLAYLRVLCNPRDQQALLRIINIPPRGIGPTTVERLLEEAARSGRTLLHVLLDPELPEGVKGKARKAVADVGILLAELRERPRQIVTQVLMDVIETTHYLDYLGDFDRQDAGERRDNVFELVAAVKEYDLDHADGSLEQFLVETSLVQDQDDLSEVADQVVILTLHSAKGLEFPVVFLPALEEGVLPHQRAIKDNDVEEERRLCYVGVTRAREQLFLSHARVRYRFGQPEPGAASRFLHELPSDLGKRIDIGYGSSSVREGDGSSLVFEPEPDVEPEPLTIGENVVHGTFGSGTVTAIRGAGIRARITVQFDSVGEKVLLAEFARLRRG